MSLWSLTGYQLITLAQWMEKESMPHLAVQFLGEHCGVVISAMCVASTVMLQSIPLTVSPLLPY